MRVGTRTAARTSVTSTSIAIRYAVRAAPGLRLRRMCHTNQSTKAASVAFEGISSRARASRNSRSPHPERIARS